MSVNAVFCPAVSLLSCSSPDVKLHCGLGQK